jgi:RNA recognition motif-containing protein
VKTVFVGNMDCQTTENDLRTLFGHFGEIGHIHIINDLDTGLPRGFAFVEMADDVEAAKAIADLNGKELAGRTLRVNEAAPRLERTRPLTNFSGPGSR